MYENVIYNRNMFYRDKLYDYKKFCERIALVKSKVIPYNNIYNPNLNIGKTTNSRT